MDEVIATPAWDALEELRADGETLTIAELGIYLERVTGLRWPVRRVERLVPAAYRAHGLKGQTPIRYRRGVWGAT